MKQGERVGNYIIESEIGTGGLARVFRARHADEGTLHALKIVQRVNPNNTARLVREARAQARLKHTNVVRVTEVLSWEGKPCLVMELVEGPSLFEFLRAYRPTMAEALEIFRGVVLAMDAAHRAGLVHRDLKPSNVLLAQTPNGLLAKVCDFGLVKTSTADDGQKLTRPGATLGTPQYMAPEQFRDAGTVDSRADMWSLGCILYELVTCRRAFDSSSQVELWKAVKEGRYTPAQEIAPDIPPRVITAITGLLIVEADARIPTCDTIYRLLYDESIDPANAAHQTRPSALSHDAIDALEKVRKRKFGQTVKRITRNFARGLALSLVLGLPLALALGYALVVLLADS